MRTNLKGLIFLFAFIFSSINLYANYKKELFNDYVIYEKKGKFNEIIFILLDEIAQNGFTSSYEANIGSAVKNISSFYKKEAIFTHAKKIGFCRQTLTLEMMEENPNNLMFCPLSIALYELKDEENVVKIIYRFAKIENYQSKVLKKVNDEIIKLIENSLE